MCVVCLVAAVSAANALSGYRGRYDCRGNVATSAAMARGAVSRQAGRFGRCEAVKL